MDLTSLLLNTRKLLNEPTASFWTDAVLTGYINEGIRNIAERSGCYRKIDTVTTTPSTRLVSFTGYKCLAVEYAGKALIKITPLQVGHAKLDGVYPQFWYEHGDYIGIEPVPAEAYSLTVYVAGIPLSLSESNTTPLIPVALHWLIVYYAVSRALEQDRKPTEAMQYMSMFYNELEFMTHNILPNVPDGYEDLRFK